MAETKFIRANKDRDFSVINNTVLKDTRLSWKAKGLMAYLLMLPEDWEIYLTEVEKHSTDGRDSLRTAINELKQYGYLETETKKENGKFAGVSYKIIEKPKGPQTGKPQTEIPYTEKPQAENPQLLNTEFTKYEFKQNTELNSSAKAGTETVKQKSDFQIVMDSYFQNYKNLYEQKAVLTEKPIVNMKQAGKMIKDLLPVFGKDKILSALDKALLDNWIVGQGYSLTTILSSNQLNKLINSKGVPARQNYNCVHEFDDKIMLEEM